MTRFGVVLVFFANTSIIITASESIRYIIRHVNLPSRIRSSWQRAPTVGIGLDFGNPTLSPRCKRNFSASSGGGLTVC